jgi:hypothetical protein
MSSDMLEFKIYLGEISSCIINSYRLNNINIAGQRETKGVRHQSNIPQFWWRCALIYGCGHWWGPLTRAGCDKHGQQGHVSYVQV